ncbi:uncharacterized protein LOC126747944 [Anthonomus grandis grandis]|uniref:uncharacterized protein LOC126747944 n=1 Tax=Anthonomus grandis grandis TaxID=2921223 RepID=UPI0021651B1D|nr:uncharacterized protein LOC126747944 [Anthonomus grandis grandis]
MGARLIQINLHHCKAATAALQKCIADNNIQIALTQEPYTYRGQIRGLGNLNGRLVSDPKEGPNLRSCIFIRKDIEATPLWEFCDRDTAAVKVQIKTAERSYDTIIVSAYFPHDQQGEPPPTTVRRLINHQRLENLIIGCDANAHHTIWGSTGTNKRGESLLNYCAASGLNIINVGEEPTFVNILHREIIDLTIGKGRICDLVKKWHVSDEPSLSDHRYIRFDLESMDTNPETYRNARKTDWDLFNEILGRELENCPTEAKDNVELEVLTESVTEAIKVAFENSCPLSKPRQAGNTS